jgi:tetratricopeptide (TPR) repeat protein
MRPILAAFILAVGCASAATEVPAAIEVGAHAPMLDLVNEKGQQVIVGESFTSPTLFLFMKASDRYSSETIHALNEVFIKSPAIKDGVSRVAVFTRVKPGEVPPTLEFLRESEWTVLYDMKDAAFHDYLIIATPTTVLVGSDSIVAATHPGYDAGLANDVRLSIAKVTHVEVPSTASTKAEKPNMALQMGRRLVQRGLWERALPYYEKAGQEGDLSAAAQLELARILVELDRKDEATKILDSLEERLPQEQLDHVRELLGREKSHENAKPPVINK